MAKSFPQASPCVRCGVVTVSRREKYCSDPCYRAAQGEIAREGFSGRFWSKVSIPANVISDCWLWRATSGHLFGYGQTFKNGRREAAHRAAWIELNGPIPAGLFVMHRCDNPRCVNPMHLALGTARENMTDKITKGRSRDKFGRSVAAITETMVREIRQRHAAGESHSTLARAYGVSPATVGRMCLRQTWGHVQ